MLPRPGDGRDAQTCGEQRGVLSGAPEAIDTAGVIAPDKGVHPTARNQESSAAYDEFVDIAETITADAPTVAQTVIIHMDGVEGGDMDYPIADDDATRAALPSPAGWPVAGS
jgi:hypothetical protein